MDTITTSWAGDVLVAGLVILTVLVVVVFRLVRERCRRVGAPRDAAAAQEQQVLVDVFAELRAQRQAASHDARTALIRAAHDAMNEAERRQEQA